MLQPEQVRGAVVCAQCHLLSRPETRGSGAYWVLGIIGIAILVALNWIIGLVMVVLVHVLARPRKVCSGCGAKELLPPYSPRAQDILAKRGVRVPPAA
jgi:hypothetical protein